MKIKDKYLLILWQRNGPTGGNLLREVIETFEGYYFEVRNSSLFQMSKEDFEKARLKTIERMPNIKVEYSQIIETK